MIPIIEQIVEDLLSGAITKHQAVTWLNIHAEEANRSLRDEFAMFAIIGWRDSSNRTRTQHQEAEDAYMIAAAMMEAREAKEKKE